jgi:hypothetical protein
VTRRRWTREVGATAVYGFAALASVAKRPREAPRNPAQNEWVMTCGVTYGCPWFEYVAGTWPEAEAVRVAHEGDCIGSGAA